MSNCIYCNRVITQGSLRCMDCNKIWNEGRGAGRLEVKSTLKEILQHLNNLVDLEK